VQRSQHDDRSDGGTCELGGDIRRDSGEAQYIDLEHLSGATRRFEIVAAVVPQTEIQTLSDRGLFDDLGVAFELVADCGSNEICSVRVKALLNHQIDMAEVDEPEIDRDLFTLIGLGSQLMHAIYHRSPSICPPCTIHVDVIVMETNLVKGGPAMDARRSFYLASRKDDFAEPAADLSTIDSTDIPYVINAWTKDRLSARSGALLRCLIALHGSTWLS
jgi:hypothetical protein